MVRRRSDPHYRRLWLGDWRTVLIANGAHASNTVELIVITAPGSDVLPWDPSQCTHAPELPCSGKHGCQVDPEALKAWNDTAPARWSALHRAAATAVRRRCPGFKMAYRAWEPQRRGAMHQNVVVAAGTARQKAQAALYRQELIRRAPQYGFGYVDRKRQVRESLHAARYLAKYLSEGTGKMGIGELAASGDAPRVIALVGRHLTQATGCTMRSRRRERGIWCLARNLECSIDDARLVREKIEARHRFSQWHARLYRRRWTSPPGWNEALELAHLEAVHELRWLALQAARAGLQPEPLD